MPFLVDIRRAAHYPLSTADLFTEWDQFNRRSIDDELESEVSNHTIPVSGRTHLRSRLCKSPASDMIALC